MEIEKSMIAPMLSIPGAAVASVDDEEEKAKADVSAEKLQALQEKKDFYHDLIKEKTVSTLRYHSVYWKSVCCFSVVRIERGSNSTGRKDMENKLKCNKLFYFFLFLKFIVRQKLNQSCLVAIINDMHRNTLTIPLRRRFSYVCLLYTSPSPRDATLSRMPSSA